MRYYETAMVLGVILFFLGSSVSARPQIPTQYYGVISSDGKPMEGKTVIVRDNDLNKVSVNVQTTDADGIYLVHVLWDDPETGEDEGVEDGELISFFVDSRKIKTLQVGEQGGSIETALALTGEETTDPSFDRSSGSEEEGDLMLQDDPKPPAPIPVEKDIVTQPISEGGSTNPMEEEGSNQDQQVAAADAAIDGKQPNAGSPLVKTPDEKPNIEAGQGSMPLYIPLIAFILLITGILIFFLKKK